MCKEDAVAVLIHITHRLPVPKSTQTRISLHSARERIREKYTDLSIANQAYTQEYTSSSAVRKTHVLLFAGL
jgi:hypothetical protein